MIIGADVLAALEEHVLEQVRKAGVSWALVLGTHVVPEVYGDQRARPVGQEHDPKTVLESFLNEVTREFETVGHKSLFGATPLEEIFLQSVAEEIGRIDLEIGHEPGQLGFLVEGRWS